jgi:hypothetical protein
MVERSQAARLRILKHKPAFMFDGSHLTTSPLCQINTLTPLLPLPGTQQPVLTAPDRRTTTPPPGAEVGTSWLNVLSSEGNPRLGGLCIILTSGPILEIS